MMRTAVVANFNRIFSSARRLPAPSFSAIRCLSNGPSENAVKVSETKATKSNSTPKVDTPPISDEELKSACGDVNDDEEMEQEEMWVEAHETLGLDKREWGGPRRGGRLPEPTRYGDWERKGRCTDF